MSAVVDASGALWSWGQNTYGQLGHGCAGEPQQRPTRVAGLSGERVTHAEAQLAVVVAVTKRGDAYTFGHDASGRLGHGDTIDRYSPEVVEALRARWLAKSGRRGSWAAM